MKTKLLFIGIFLFFFTTTFSQNIEKQILDKNSVPKFTKFEKALSYTKGNELQILNKYLKLSSNDKLVRISEITNNLSEKVISFQQFYKNVKLEYGQYKIHIKNQKVKIINGNFVRINNLSVNPKITEDAALKIALKKINAKKYFWEQKSTS